MEKTIYDINNLFNVIKEYSLKLHKATFRYGIDYIKYDMSLQEKYPEIFEEIQSFFIPRGVTTTSQSNTNYKNIIECGNKYEINTMMGIPKATLTPINENETKIDDLTWVSLENLSTNEIDEYKDKLKLIITLNI